MNAYLRKDSLSDKFDKFLKNVLSENNLNLEDRELLRGVMLSVDTHLHLLIEEARHQINVLQWQSTIEAQKLFGRVESSKKIPYVDGIKEILGDSFNHRVGSDKTYLLLQKDTGFVKIGKSNNPLRRIKEVQMPNVKLVGYLEYDCEKYLHDCFSKNRIDKEWFQFKKKDFDVLVSFFKVY